MEIWNFDYLFVQICQKNVTREVCLEIRYGSEWEQSRYFHPTDSCIPAFLSLLPVFPRLPNVALFYIITMWWSQPCGHQVLYLSCWLVVLVGWEEGGGQAPASQLSLALTALTNTDLSAALLDSWYWNLTVSSCDRMALLRIITLSAFLAFASGQ